MKRIFCFLVGSIFLSISIGVLVISINLLVYGYSFFSFLLYLLQCWEFYFFIPGIYLIKKDRF